MGNRDEDDPYPKPEPELEPGPEPSALGGGSSPTGTGSRSGTGIVKRDKDGMMIPIRIEGVIPVGIRIQIRHRENEDG